MQKKPKNEMPNYRDWVSSQTFKIYIGLLQIIMEM